jgi:hypothetical protein
MTRLILTTFLLFIAVFSYSQQEEEILSKALQSYKKELPELERQAFKELRKLDKSDRKPKNCEFKNYHFIIIPMFKLKEAFVHYHIGDTDTFAKYIDFWKMYNDFEAFVFKDTIYKGSLHFSDFDNSYFSASDTNKHNKPSFNVYLNLTIQILKFKPDVVFYPECRIFMCFIKEGRLYIGRWSEQLRPLDYILPAEEFIKTNPSFIRDLKDNKYPRIKGFIELQ